MTVEVAELAVWRALLAGAFPGVEELVAGFAKPHKPSLAEIASLDRALAPFGLEDPALARRVILEAADATMRAARKGLRGSHGSFRASRALVEQASGARVAGYKAERMRAAGVELVIDACCGAGGDTRSFAEIFGRERVVGIDRGPLATHLTVHNAACEVLCSDIEEGVAQAVSTLRGAGGDRPIGLHIDPARRSGRERRGAALAALMPSFGKCMQIVARHEAQDIQATMIKLSPATSILEVEDEVAACGQRSERGLRAWEFEWIADASGLVQGLLVFGGLASGEMGTRRATRIEEDGTISTLVSPADDMQAGAMPADATDGETARGGETGLEPGRWLVRPDPVLERARLFGASLAPGLGRRVLEIHPGLGLFVAPAETPVSPVRTGAWRNEAHRIAAALPWRVRKLRAWLSAQAGCVVEIRTRGRAAEFETVRASVPFDPSRRGRDGAYVLWALRFGDRRVAVFSESTSESWTLAMPEP